ncbi:hypothetical protein O3M35_009552 [Rhynocoris fuscipes]|uniref:Uncharacterized protein n=1 Tax=Rhynocoris fuscipes TaxID=488301 RepID=A0AAW1D461_9HEMI
MSLSDCNLFRHVALEEFYIEHKTNWKRLFTHLSVVILYQVLRPVYQGDGECCAINRQSTSAYLFLCAASIWASNLDLLPTCLNIWGSFEAIYDIVAVTVIANLLLNYVWSEVIQFIEVITYHLCLYSENTIFGAIVQFFFDKEAGFICLSDAIALIILLWVLCGIGIIDEIWNCMRCAIMDEDNRSQYETLL